jgi:hypothetical protein
MRPWLVALLTGDLKIAHAGICERCDGEMHGNCLLAWEAFLKPCKCRCRRGACNKPKYPKPAFKSQKGMKP